MSWFRGMMLRASSARVRCWTGVVGNTGFGVLPDVVVTVRDDGDVTGVHGGAATTDVG
jgi:hypothetical protein